MSAIPQPENFPEGNRQPLVGGNVPYGTENVLSLIDETANRLRKISQGVYQIVEMGLYRNLGDERRISVLRLGDGALMMSWLLEDKFPDTLKKAEKRRLNLVKTDHPENEVFWQGEIPSQQPSTQLNLTKKETAVLDLMMKGLSNPGIAEALSLPKTTVVSRIKNIFTKTGTTDRVQTVLLAYETLAGSSQGLESIPKPDLGWTKHLSRSEREIFIRAKDGLTKKELAAGLGLSEETVKSHHRHIYEKSGITNRVQLAVSSWLLDKGIESNTVTDPALVDRAPRKRQRSQTKPFGLEEETESDSINIKLERPNRKLIFRSNVERALPKIIKVMPEHGKPTKDQTFTISDVEILDELFRRRLITLEQLESGQIDRATVVAAMIIKTDTDEGFLSAEQVEQGMQIIREQETKYLERFEPPVKKSK